MNAQSLDDALAAHSQKMDEIHERTTSGHQKARLDALTLTVLDQISRGEYNVSYALDNAFVLLTLISTALEINHLAARAASSGAPNTTAILEKLEADLALLKPLYTECTPTVVGLELNGAALDRLFE